MQLHYAHVCPLGWCLCLSAICLFWAPASFTQSLFLEIFLPLTPIGNLVRSFPHPSEAIVRLSLFVLLQWKSLFFVYGT